jgi:hypothetical protein
MKEAERLLSASCPGITTRSLDSTYNCMGMIFAARRTAIDIDSLEKIIQDDGYTPLASADHLHAGDIVVYAADGEFTHVALVVREGLVAGIGADPNHLLLSQWGYDGEYLHSLRQVPFLYGAPARFFTDRKSA